MPDLGYTSVGASTESLENLILGTRVTASSSGTSDSVSIYAVETSASNAHNWQGGLYDDAGNLVGNSSSTNNATTTPGWRTVTLAGLTVTNATTYVVSAFAGGGGGTIDVNYDTGGDGKRETTATFSTWPNPITWDASPTRNYSIYLTYTEAGGTILPQIMSHYYS